VNVESRRRRRMRENLKKAFIWVFVAFFVVSIVGVAIVTVAPR
jgi:ABC-type iron transport system FetAB permease component